MNITKIALPMLLTLAFACVSPVRSAITSEEARYARVQDYFNRINCTVYKTDLHALKIQVRCPAQYTENVRFMCQLVNGNYSLHVGYQEPDNPIIAWNIYDTGRWNPSDSAYASFKDDSDPICYMRVVSPGVLEIAVEKCINRWYRIVSCPCTKCSRG